MADLTEITKVLDKLPPFAKEAMKTIRTDLKTGSQGNKRTSPKIDPGQKEAPKKESAIEIDKAKTDPNKQPTGQAVPAHNKSMEAAAQKQAIEQVEMAKFVQQRTTNLQNEGGVLGQDIGKNNAAKHIADFQKDKSKGLDPLKKEQIANKYVNTVKNNRTTEGVLDAKFNAGETRREFDKLTKLSSHSPDSPKAAGFAFTYENERHKFVGEVKLNRGLEGSVSGFDAAKEAKNFDQLALKSGKVNKETGGMDIKAAAKFAKEYEGERHKLIQDLKTTKDAKGNPVDLSSGDLDRVRNGFDKQNGLANDKTAGVSTNIAPELLKTAANIRRSEVAKAEENGGPGYVGGPKKGVGQNAER